jgi:hypothetical protein
LRQSGIVKLYSTSNASGTLKQKRNLKSLQAGAVMQIMSANE